MLMTPPSLNQEGKYVPDNSIGVRNKTTGEIYRNVREAGEAMGVAEGTMYKYVKSGRPLNGYYFEQLNRVSKADKDMESHKRRIVQMPPLVTVGDYLLVKSDRVVIYGSLESVASRCNISKENISKLANTRQRASQGLKVIHVENEEMMVSLMGGTLEDAYRERASEVSRVTLFK